MVRFALSSAILAITSLSAVMAAPAPAPDAAVVIEPQVEGNYTISFISQKDAHSLNEIAKRDLAQRSRIGPQAVESRQDAFGAYWQDFNFQGRNQYIRPPIDGLGHYIGDDWNDKISSFWNYSPDKKCTYYTEYDWNGGYCWGNWISMAGRGSAATLGSNLNDQISCLMCQWN